MKIESKKLHVFTSYIVLAIGGGMIYVSANEVFKVGADSVSTSTHTSTWMTVVLVCGIAMVAASVMSGVFIFVTGHGAR